MNDWRLHSALVAVLIAQLGLWLLGHRSDDQLRAALDSPEATARIEARFLLLERGAVDRDEAERTLAEALLGSPDVLEAEFAYTTAVCKYTGAKLQYGRLKERIAAGEVDAGFWRAFVLLRRKIGVVVGGSSGRIKRQELAWWLEAVEGGSLDADELLEWIAAHP